MAPSVPKLLLLALLCSCLSLVAHAADTRTHKVLDIESMKPKTVCSESKAVPSSTGGTTLPLHHRHGPCSPVSSKKTPPTLEEMLQHDALRAAYIQRKLNRTAGGGGVQQSDATATVPTALGTAQNTLEYVIPVRLGSQAATQTVLIDTGSDVSWVHCKPCAPCHDQSDALFDPSASTTYSPFSCSSGACAQLGVEGAGCRSSQCQYQVGYGDGSATIGTYASDTLKLGSNSIKNFQFGCSRVDAGFDEDQTDGLMGLGRGPQSLVSQTTGKFGKAFSYCLPASSGSSGFLTLGAGTTTSGFVKTPLFRVDQPTFYIVRLQAIRVEGKQLNIPSSVFSDGTLLDSGTVLTYLPQPAYSALSSAFKAGMKQYPSAPSRGDLDTCFNFDGHTTITMPTIELVFRGGAVVKIEGNGVLVDNCLAFSANDNPSIIGNVQQRTFEVLYDVGGGSIGFRAGAC